MPCVQGPVARALLAAEPSRAAGRAAEILRDRAYQVELPRARPELAVDLPFPWLDVLLRAALVGSLAVLTWLALRWALRNLRRPAPDLALGAGDGAAAPVQIPIAAAEALAAQGRHAEAIHALLLQTLAALTRAARLAPSLTSREIVAQVPLPERAREALAGLVAAVERSWFGGAEPGALEYRACLARFRAFVDAYRGRA